MEQSLRRSTSRCVYCAKCQFCYYSHGDATVPLYRPNVDKKSQKQ